MANANNEKEACYIGSETNLSTYGWPMNAIGNQYNWHLSTSSNINLTFHTDWIENFFHPLLDAYVLLEYIKTMPQDDGDWRIGRVQFTIAQVRDV